ncbi:MAG: hypothetical protein ABIP94_23085 [Planctomycetota bacterium]
MRPLLATSRLTVGTMGDTRVLLCGLRGDQAMLARLRGVDVEDK